MKMSLQQASAILGMPAPKIVLLIAPLVNSLDDCWPEIDKGLVDTLASMYSLPMVDETEKEPSRETADNDPSLPISKPAAMILDKLYRQRHWGSKLVSWDTLHNHYCHGIKDLRSAMDELLDADLLTTKEDRDGPFSLNTSRKKDIVDLVDSVRTIND